MSERSANELVFLPLGGVGEIGMNMGAYGFGPEGDRKWLVVDCGVSFAGPDLPGIDLIMPDPSFLEEQGDNVLALVITHVHEDHFGAVLDLWPDFDKPVYAAPFAQAMIAAKRAANEIIATVDLHDMTVGVPFEVGPFTIEPIAMAHSIVESTSLLISTPVGRALHSGDWKIDPTPVIGPKTDEVRLPAIGAEPGHLALVCDSTNALRDGVSPSESEIGETLARLIAKAPQRVMVTTFASNLGRVVSVARAAQKAGRQVVLAGRALHRITTIGRELGLLDDVPAFLDQDMFAQLPRDKIVVLSTGSQGEARAATARIAQGSHPHIALDRGDTMIFSSWAIPGNEKAVLDIQNRFIDQGVKVITNSDAPVHVTGHPRRDELRQLYDWVKPDVLVPVHGEAAHLRAQAELGRTAGIADVLEARNGDLVRLFPRPEVFKNEIEAGELYLDGYVLCTPEESGVRERRRLSFGGMVMVSLCVDKRGDIVGPMQIGVEGVPVLEDADEDQPEDIVTSAIRGTLRSLPNKRRGDPDVVGEAIRRAVRAELNAYWGKKPNVRVFVHRV